MPNNGPIPQLNPTMRLLLKTKAMLHPLLIIPLREILSRVRPPTLRPIRRAIRSLHSAGEQIPQLERLDEVGVPDHAAVLGAELRVGLVDGFDAAGAFVEGFLRAEDGDVGLHYFLHCGADFVGGFGARGCADFVEGGDGVGAGVGGDIFVGLARGEVVADGVGDCAAEDDEVEEGVCAEAVCAVHGDAGGFSAGEEAGDDLVFALGVDGDYFAGVFGGDATHVVVDGGEDGDWLLSDVDAREDGGGLGDSWEAVM